MRGAPDKLADFAVLSDDYFAVREDDINDITSVLTMVIVQRKVGSSWRGNPWPLHARCTHYAVGVCQSATAIAAPTAAAIVHQKAVRSGGAFA